MNINTGGKISLGYEISYNVKIKKNIIAPIAKHASKR
jgi:hypothetical protein